MLGCRDGAGASDNGTNSRDSFKKLKPQMSEWFVYDNHDEDFYINAV